MQKEVDSKIVILALSKEIEAVKKRLYSLPKEEMINPDTVIGFQIMTRITCLKETLDELEMSLKQMEEA